MYLLVGGQDFDTEEVSNRSSYADSSSTKSHMKNMVVVVCLHLGGMLGAKTVLLRLTINHNAPSLGTQAFHLSQKLSSTTHELAVFSGQKFACIWVVVIVVSACLFA